MENLYPTPDKHEPSDTDRQTSSYEQDWTEQTDYDALVADTNNPHDIDDGLLEEGDEDEQLPTKLPTIGCSNEHPAPWSRAQNAIRHTTITPQNDRGWPVIDTSLNGYEAYFRNNLGGEDGDISNLLPDRDEEPLVAVDLMATPRALRDLRARLEAQRGAGNFAFRGVAVGMDDTRTPQQQRADEQQGLTFIHGNLRHLGTWQRLEHALDGAKADLVMERALAGLNTIPLHREVYEAALQRLWSITRLGGTMLLELPGHKDLRVAGISFQAAVNNLRAQGAEVEPDRFGYGLSLRVKIRRTF